MAGFKGVEEPYSIHADVQEFLTNIVGDIRSFAERQVSQIKELVNIGVALSAEKNLDRLLEMIVTQARLITNADGATLYIRSETGRFLEFAIVCSESLHLRMGGTGERISWPPVPLETEDGVENHRNVSAYCALQGKVVNIADVYQAAGFDFEGTREFDQRTGYHSKSMLLVPMRNHEDEVIGVLQLLNAQDRLTGEVIDFSTHLVDLVTSLASLAAIGLTKTKLIRDLENLFNCFIKAIADAIDEKSPSTAGHVLRVAELTEKLALEVNRIETGPLAAVHFDENELTEIRMAAWMHDVGKITTPEHIIDKSTKLETIFDRIELIRCRIELLKREAEIDGLKAGLGGDASGSPSVAIQELDRQFAFLEAVNRGSEHLDEEAIQRINHLARQTVEIQGERIPLLDEDEVHNLMIPQGTLTSEERTIIKNHVHLTARILGSLPFPKKMNRVSLFAGMHHEKLDGSGYPAKLSGEAIPLQAKLLAVADIFEALTAADRPYKKGKQLSEVMRILETMADGGQLDGGLCDLLVESGMVAEYAACFLPERQQDDFSWRGKTYRLRNT
jgi:HD-GYP domain-containing protein (c-di-GMP phosphodiesterase class II)